MEDTSHSIQRLNFELDRDKRGHTNTTNNSNEVNPSPNIGEPAKPNDDLPTSEEARGFDTSIQNKLKEKSSPIPEEWIPKIGMIFKTVDEAYEFYNTYARRVGFSTRKDNRVLCKQTCQIRFSKFCCSKEGKRRDTDKRRLNVKNRREETRCGCMAAMKISRCKDGCYRIIDFNDVHNHIIAAPSKSHMLRSQRTTSKVKGNQAKMANDAVIASKASIELVAIEAGACENVEFTSTNLKNYLNTYRTRKMEKGEAGGILQYFEDRRSKDPSFVYAIQLDQAELVTNLFWADAQMIVDYAHFGDVVCFDTTFRMNKENRPFAVFWGVNNYKKIIIFGAALLYDETVDTFEWLFNVFLKTMGGKKPNTILTDDDVAVEKAINLVLPESHHRLCVCHIFQNAAIHLSGVFEKFKTFSKDFSNCLYDCENVDEFENAWESMINMYGLQENDWLQRLYSKRHKWALAFQRQIFFADISTTQRSESFNSCLRKYLNIRYDLLIFLRHFERVVAVRRYEELKAEFASTQSTPTMAAHVGILDFTAHVYTPPIFSLFHNEVLQQLNCKIEEDHVVSETIVEYTISAYGVNRRFKVIYDSKNDSVNCSCKKFEFVGILCRHALKILDYRRVQMLPSRYILKRWTIGAKASSSEASHGSNLYFDQATKVATYRKEMSHLLIQIVNKAAPSGDAYKMVMQVGEKLLEDVTRCLKQTTFDQSSAAFESMQVENDNIGSPCIDLNGTHVESDSIGSTGGRSVESGFSKQAKGFKDRVSTVRSSKRPKNALEKAIAKRKRQGDQSTEKCSTQECRDEGNLNLVAKKMIITNAQEFDHSLTYTQGSSFGESIQTVTNRSDPQNTISNHVHNFHTMSPQFQPPYCFMYNHSGSFVNNLHIQDTGDGPPT
ncbi:PREDICTED: protein FAR1-RELATED SEQUENCE 5-like isoform X2 [Nelumbo nucifera]|uniref:Protein FAR1-RELATED SEQUENCE n=1 Tax=Nelumbo nucifera TaxID=4432 RepID=A0A1U8BGD3_NELNU|nr:PREDICTED: protein FAR1-RELATED SEQUENCE 5-like isoform X2 [Nelumbo nucifera]